MLRSLLLLGIFALVNQPGVSDPISIPKIPKVPKPPKPDPAVVPKPGTNVQPAVQPAANQPAAVQANMQNLNEKLKDFAQEVGTEVAGEIVTAILNPSTPTTTGDAAVTSAPAFDISSYWPCVTYANSLSSCASATQSFYDLDPADQASCACYTNAGPALPVSCSPTTAAANSTASYYQMETTPTLSPKDFDEQANACWFFFSDNGFEDVASAMLRDDVPGAAFCSSVDEALKDGDGTTNDTAGAGLPATLDPVVASECTGTNTNAGPAIGVPKGILLIVAATLLLGS